MSMWGDAEAPPLPAVDFASQAVVVVAFSSRPHGGHRIALYASSTRDAALEILAMEYKPGTGCVTTATVTYPIAVAIVSPKARSVRFGYRSESAHCERLICT